ncbi:hypothetical protein [Streptomyces sp. NPDC126514]|uniref:hypothetical protein n=1 Tax=Streptomyces sp. NPDC126514 TaxID=3155210 RepID=UPI0033181B17
MREPVIAIDPGAAFAILPQPVSQAVLCGAAAAAGAMPAPASTSASAAKTVTQRLIGEQPPPDLCELTIYAMSDKEESQTVGGDGGHDSDNMPGKVRVTRVLIEGFRGWTRT